jgi:hypothetical protein
VKTTIEQLTRKPAGHSVRRAFLGGAVVGAVLVYALTAFTFRPEEKQPIGGGDEASPNPSSNLLATPWSAALATELAASSLGAAYQEGDYLFLPNRRSIWVVHRPTGRIANYHFRDNEEKTVLRSRVVTLDAKDFPPSDTLYLLSDRNLMSLLWACNQKTGDVQLWDLRADGDVAAEGQVVTSIDLMKN